MNNLTHSTARPLEILLCLTSLRLVDLVKKRFVRLFGMGPETIEEDNLSKIVLGSENRQSAKTKLSPVSLKKAQYLQAPSKQSLSEYDKLMISCEQALRKALTQLDKTTDDAESAREAEIAQRERWGIGEGGHSRSCRRWPCCAVHASIHEYRKKPDGLD